jgi:hypothetical protein
LTIVALLVAASVAACTLGQDIPRTGISTRDLTSWSKGCLHIKQAEWMAVDAAHDELLEKLRALGAPAWRTEAQRANLENSFIQEIGGASGANSDCIAVIQLEREAARLRGLLAELRIKARVATAGVVFGQGCFSALRSEVEALREVLQSAERSGASALALETTPKSPLLPSERRGAMEMRSVLGGLADQVSPAERAVTEDRLVLSMFGKRQDEEFERISAILLNVAGMEPDSQARLSEFVAALGKRRMEGRRRLLDELLAQVPNQPKIVVEVDNSVGRSVDLDLALAKLPDSARATVRNLCLGWDNFTNLQSMVESVLTAGGVEAVQQFMPPVTISPMKTGTILLASPDSPGPLGVSALLAFATPDRRKDLEQGVAVRWTEVAKGASLLASSLANLEGTPGSATSRTQELQQQMRVVSAKIDLVEAVYSAEGRFQAAMSDGTSDDIERAALSLWHDDRLSGALERELFSNTGPLNAQLPRPISPMRAIATCGDLSPAQKSELIVRIAETPRTAPLVREVVLRRLASHWQMLAEALEQEAALEAPGRADTQEDLVLPGAPKPPEAPAVRIPADIASGRSWREAWDDLQEVGERRLAAIRSAAPDGTSDSLVRRWTLDAMPWIRDSRDRCMIEQSEPGPAKESAIMAADRNLPNLLLAGLQKRWADDHSPSQGRTALWVGWVQEDIANAVSRWERDVATDGRTGTSSPPD